MPRGVVVGGEVGDVVFGEVAVETGSLRRCGA